MTEAPQTASPLDSNHAEFLIRFAGVEYNFFCERTTAFHRGIRKARALRIGGTVITAQPSQYWKLNAQGTGWTYYAAKPVGPVPVAAVVWALADNRKLIETYHQGKTFQWRITKTVASCYKCDAHCEMQSLYWHPYMGIGPQPGIRRKGRWVFSTPICNVCVVEFDTIYRQHVTLPTFEDQHWEFLERPAIDHLASKDRSGYVRWVRKFVAAGKYTAKEFKNLCTDYGNICLRCGKLRPLVADHVIPLAKGGCNDITNIQPLCAKCNGIKSDKSTDYRKRRRKISTQA